MSKTFRHILPPSSVSLSYHYSERLIRTEVSQLKTAAISENLLAILNFSPPEVTRNAISTIFNVLDGQDSSENLKNNVKQYLEAIVIENQDSLFFKSAIISYFDSLTVLPDNILTSLPTNIAIVLTAYASQTHFSDLAISLLQAQILPQATPEIISSVSASVLYDLEELKCSNFSLSESCEKLPVFMSPFVEKDQLFIENKFISNSPESRPSLYDAVLENDARSLTSAVHLRKLFDFFPNFDEKHAAAFITSISTKKCCFREYFSRLEETQKGRIIDLFRDSFNERGVDISKIPSTLDLPDTSPLDTDGCALLFNILRGLLRDAPIDAPPFLSKWKNSHAQLQYIHFLAYVAIPSLDFSNGCRMTKCYDYDPPPIPNNCWLCLDFLECVLRLSEYYPKETSGILSIAGDKYSQPLLLSCSQINKPNTEHFKKLVLSFLALVIQTHTLSNVLEVLWRTNVPFCRWMFSSYYRQNPMRKNSVIDVVGNHLNELLQSEDLEFVIDLAFQASLHNYLEIDQFIKSLVDKFSQTVLATILQFVKNMVLDSNQSSPTLLSNSLNKMFSYFWDAFSSLTSDTKLLVNTVYSICESSIPNIQKFAFSNSLPSIRTPEIKEAASDYFASFLSDKMTMTQFVQLFHQLRSNSQTLFESMEHYLILELKYIDQHENRSIEKLGQLIGNMVHENLFNEKQLKTIFSCFTRAFSTNVNSPYYLFASTALELCYAKLTVIPQCVFKLLQQPLLKTSQPQLFEKIRKISANLATPIQLTMTTTLTINPNLRRFEKLTIPPPRVCKLVQQIETDSTILHSNIMLPHLDWIALHLVNEIHDHPTRYPNLTNQLLSEPQFRKIFIEAAIYEAIRLITCNEFATYEGGFARRRLEILGRVIGKLTLAENQMINGRFLDLKRLLYYAFSQGKLFGVIPFVGGILCSASSFFDPPNPYTSAIIQVIASIGMTDLLKLYVKNQINKILNHFHVNPSNLKLLTLVPEVRQNNFDFIAPPFSLNYLLSMADIDRMIAFDEQVFNGLAASNLIIPDPPNPDAGRDKMRSAITSAAFSFLKSEGTNLAKVAASTASELIQKDFIYCTNIDLMIQTAATLTKQLAAGLTLFTVFQKLHRWLCHSLQNEFKSNDNDWINATIQANHSWIGQMLHDIVHLKALRLVQQRIEQHEEQKRIQGNRFIENLAQKSLRPIPPSLAPCEQGLTTQHQLIYQDLAELPLSPAEISLPETSPEKSIKPNEQFEIFFNQISKLISSEISQGPASQTDPLQDDSTFSVLMSKCPKMGQSFEEFLSIIRAMMKYMAKANHTINDQIYSLLLRRIVSGFPLPYVSRAQPYVIAWLRNSIPSVTLLCVFLDIKLITTKQLDKFFFDGLNRQPFNCRLFIFATRFLNHTLHETKLIQPSEMIASLTLVVSTPLSMLETSTPVQQKFIEDLQAILDKMDVPLHILSTDSKLLTMCTFDPNEYIGEVDTIIAAYNRWVCITDNEDSNDKSVLAITKEVCELGRDFFVIALCNDTNNFARLLKCVKECGQLHHTWSSIASAIVHCVGGTSMVLGYNMQKYFTALTNLLLIVSDDLHLLIGFASLLHGLRPLIMPMFTYSWIELVSERHFVYGLLTNKEHGWDAMTTILCDFIVTVVFIQDSPKSSEVFDLIYKALLRFLLVITHDFQDYFVTYAPEMVVLLPSGFSQLHNIILSAVPSNSKLVSPSAALKNISKVPGIDDFIQIQQPLKPIIEQLNFADAIKSEDDFSDLAAQLEKRSCSGVIASFVIFVSNALLPHMTTATILNDITKSHLFFVLSQLFEKLNDEAVVVLVNVLVDQLRYPSRTTIFFYRALSTLFKMNLKVSPSLGVDEIILRTLIERAVTPPPHPWGLRLFIRELMTNPEVNFWERPFVRQSDTVFKFLRATSTAFCNDD